MHKPQRSTSLGMNISIRRNRRFLTAFTLIELLMVIAIIALLMAILMPVLGRVKKLAKTVICRSNLHQWGLMFSAYTSENDGFFHEGWDENPGGSWRRQWTESLRPYSGPSSDFWCCPTATRPIWDKHGNFVRPESYTFSAWGIYPFFNEIYGSYGVNGWVCNPQPGEEPDKDAKDFWRSADVRSANNIPLFLDAGFLNQWPFIFDEPPPWDGQAANPSGSNHMGRFCLNRHNGFINGLFVDFSVRKVGLKELWKLKWHRNFDVSGPYTPRGGVIPDDWPPWMRNFKDYY